MVGEYLSKKDQRKRRVGVWNRLESAHIRWDSTISRYTQTRAGERNNRRRSCRWKSSNQSGDGMVPTMVKQLTSNPLAISTSAISRNQTKQKQTIAIISALIVLVRSLECLLNRVIAVEIWIFNNRKRLGEERRLGRTTIRLDSLGKWEKLGWAHWICPCGINEF